MELVIKPTRACNFHCSFCSSNLIPNKVLESDRVISFLKEFPETKSIIVNGGDPLMMKPQFYYDIIEHIRSEKLNCIISFTTNLWDWYINTDKWDDLFRQPEIGICTSFQYGNGRIKPNYTLFTEDDFLKIFYKFEELYNEKLTFVSVVTNENAGYAIDNVKLAKKLGTECKLNPAVNSGRQGYHYPLDKMYDIYLQLFETDDLYKYESNCLNLINFFNNRDTTCPLSNRTCYKNIKCMGPDGNMSTCPSLDDDYIYDSYQYKIIKNECYMCEFFNICNGCMKRVHDLKDDTYDCYNLKNTLMCIKNICNNMK